MNRICVGFGLEMEVHVVLRVITWYDYALSEAGDKWPQRRTYLIRGAILP